MTAQPQIEPVTDEDVLAAVNLPRRALEPQTKHILEQDRRRVAERQAARPLEKINCDESYGRSYIPVAPGWEVQTKGKGSTFRLCEPSGDRLAVPDSPYLHATIERMALAIHAHRVAMEEEIERLRAEVAAHRKHDVLRCDALMKAEAEVAKLNAACAAKDAALNRCADWFGRPSPHFDDKDSLAYAVHAALSDTAGAGWIDATGAVEATAVVFAPEHGVEVCAAVPDDWAGDTVKIVRVRK